MFKNNENGIRIGIGRQLMIVIVTLTVICVSMISIKLISSSREIMFDFEHKYNLDIVERLSYKLNVDNLINVIEGKDELSSYYSELRSQLDEYRELAGMVSLYTIYEKEGKYYYAVDGNYRSEEDGFYTLGKEETKPNEALKESFITGETKKGYITEINGEYILSSYVPIKNTKGKVIAVIGYDDNADYLNSAIAKFKKHTWIYLIITTVISIITGLIYSRVISSRINNINEGLERLNKGDFLFEFEVPKHNDEFKDLALTATKMKNSLKLIFAELKSDSEVLEQKSTDLSEFLLDTKKSVESTRSVMKEVSVIGKKQSRIIDDVEFKSSHSIETMEKLSNILDSLYEVNSETHEIVTNSERMLKSVNSSIIRNDRIISESNEQVLNLTEKLKEMNEALIIIQNISEQTSLLSLNASIEAARFGKSGKGFAVVAFEIRKLSNNTKESVRKIESVLNSVSISSYQTVAKMDTVVTSTNSNKKLIEDLGNSIEKIIQSNKGYTSIIGEIKHIQKTTLRNVETVNDAVSDAKSIANEIMSIVDEANLESKNQLDKINKVNYVSEDVLKISQQIDEEISRYKTK